MNLYLFSSDANLKDKNEAARFIQNRSMTEVKCYVFFSIKIFMVSVKEFLGEEPGNFFLSTNETFKNINK